MRIRRISTACVVAGGLSLLLGSTSLPANAQTAGVSRDAGARAQDACADS